MDRNGRMSPARPKEFGRLAPIRLKAEGRPAHPLESRPGALLTGGRSEKETDKRHAFNCTLTLPPARESSSRPADIKPIGSGRPS